MISFFAKEPFILNKPSGKTLQRVSSIIRGKEIASFLGAKLNPTEGFENDVCIHLKPRDFRPVKSNDYIDVMDDMTVTQMLKGRPELKVIALTNPHKQWLESVLPNKVIHIPHHHVNFERKKKTRKEITTCGYIGANQPFQRRIVAELKEVLEKEGIKFVSLLTFEKREDTIKFYESIDIQVIGSFGFLTHAPYYHPNKIINAMSFGIPTVSEQKLGYKDVDGFYYKAKNMRELVSEVKKLQKGWDAERLINEAEKYHIENISKLYQKL